MASTSSSSIQKIFKYDVFLSFRGEDTRKTFVDHLHLALVNKGIITYKDDETIEKGERINDQLLRSIDDSRIHIIVFSKNYANSSWCLKELVKIMECQRTSEQTAYPVFYDVEPTEVRHQNGAVGEAFKKHLRRSWSFYLLLDCLCGIVATCCNNTTSSLNGSAIVGALEKEEEVGRWRKALKEAADLAGIELKNSFNGREAIIIKQIVQDISLKLSFFNWSVDENLVGMENRVKNVVLSLETDSDDVRMIGIKGMGGAGKTTLARSIYDRLSIQFEGKIFVENVREGSKGFGLKELQKQVVSAVSNASSINVTSVSDGKNMMKRMMGSRKVLVVLDDVDHTEQLEALAGELTWFKPGSRIIITTRDEQVLVAHGVHSDNIHDVNLLSRKEAICLFSRYAFKREIPIQGYEELSEEVVHYAAGLPLTIKVLGSFLCGRLETEWEDAIKRLRTIPLKETLEKMELSYDGLENDQKEIFLEVACILKGEKKDVAIRTLESCGFHAQIGLRVLEQKSLITISHDDRLLVHDHIEEMGMNIVRRSHPEEPNRHSRLWIKEEIEDILFNDLGTKATRSMKLIKDLGIHPAIIMKSLRKMEELRVLYVSDDDLSKKWEIDEGGQYLPNTLQSLIWSRYPLCCLPKTFGANNLVNLELPYSYISQLWEDGERKALNKLKFINLRCSKLRTFDLGMTPNLEILNLSGCTGFVELQIPIECPKLRIVKLANSVVSKFNLEMTPNIEELDLEMCEDLVELQMPAKLPKLSHLNLRHSVVSKLNLGMTHNIKRLILEHCEDLIDLQMPAELSKVNYLNLSNSKVSKLNLGMTPNIKELYLEECKDLVELQMPAELPKLDHIILSHCKVSKLNLGVTPNIEKLYLKGCIDLVEIQMPVELSNLRYLNLSHSKVSKLNLGMSPNIDYLNLEECVDLVELQMPIELPMLKKLILGDSKVSKLNLGLTPHIKQLFLKGCKDLVELQMPNELSKLYDLSLNNSKVSKLNLGMTPNIKELYLKECKDLVELKMPVELPKLTRITISHCKVSKLNLGMTPHIEVLKLENWDSLQEIHAPVGCLKYLDYLNLSGCSRFEYFMMESNYSSVVLDYLATLELIVESLDICPLHPNSNLPKFRFKCKYDEPLPSSRGDLEKLISFGLCACTNLESFSSSICSLQHLRVLTLEGGIPEAPKDLWQLESLEKLSLSLKEIKHLPDSICMMKRLKSLVLKSCWLLERLPMDLDKLDSLEELDLTDCRSLRDIPDKICNMKCLEYLHLPDCILVEKLPEELGRLECLKVLNVEGAGISCLPQSIIQLKGLRIIGSM